MGKKTNTTTKAAAATNRAGKPAVTNQRAVRKAATAPAKAAKAAAPKPKRATKPTASKAPTFGTDDVALRAYFIAEKRRTDGLLGDEHHDWLEAERQLLAESKSPKKSPRTKAFTC